MKHVIGLRIFLTDIIRTNFDSASVNDQKRESRQDGVVRFALLPPSRKNAVKLELLGFKAKTETRIASKPTPT
jgi:hypothetical protein